ncbi:MAG: LD-carboxypeptidase [Bacteroidales bacterium]|jgi:muramoyltetrapeptide carboxypeptidase|nr:LD-carboxypeptidase [Bacteroidales bacterium]HKL92951.1 LD-carboxypeptidase [Bacteroidales bacterium]
MKKPSFLKIGDNIHLVAPAGAIDPQLVQGAVDCLTHWGYHAVVAPNTALRQGRFSGSLSQRLNDLQSALDNPDCQAILCVRGGYGCNQLMDHLTFDGFLEQPKWLIGFSDVTQLHMRLMQLGFASIHGGMARQLHDYHNSDKKGMQPARALHTLLKGNPLDYLVANHAFNRIGKTEGVLWGGNLSILFSLRGTPYETIPDNGILFIEDVGEKPYVIERMLINLKQSGILSTLKGLIVGQFTEYEEDPGMGYSLQELISRQVSEYDFPICFGFPVGHVFENMPLIQGARVRLNVQTSCSTLNYL